MVQPNETAKLFCEWMLGDGIPKLTSSQRVVANQIITSVDTSTPVDLNVWNNFLKFAPSRWEVYRMQYWLTTTDTPAITID